MMWRWSIRWTILRRRSQLEDIDSRILKCWNHPEVKLQEKSQSGRAEGSTRWPIPSRKTDRFYDLLLRPGDSVHEVLDYSDLFRITLHGDDVQESDTRWDEVCYQFDRCPQAMSLKVNMKNAFVGLTNSKPFWHYEKELEQHHSQPK